MIHDDDDKINFLRNKFAFFSNLINYLLEYSILGTSSSMFKQEFDSTLDADLTLFRPGFFGPSLTGGEGFGSPLCNFQKV